MNNFEIKVIKFSKKVYKKIFNPKELIKPDSDQNPNSAAQTIYDALINDSPCMIGRFGSTEMTCLCNYIGVKKQKNKYLSYIKGKTYAWWWEPKIIKQMQDWSGFFPAEVDKIEDFCELMLKDIKEVDILGSWLPQEHYFEKDLAQAKKVRFIFLDPFWSEIPWTKALEGKKVLVVHPFAKTIEQQYKKRKLLFEGDILPDFELKTIKAVQTIAGVKTEFTDWFSALKYMEEEIDKVDFDICLIGCGAYGFPLAAHVKKMGKKGFHMGGSLQLLFGIRGKRWENPNYSEFNYSKLINKNWVKPAEEEKPEGASKVEGACYW